MQVWLYLYFPTLQLDALYSEQAQQPLVVVDSKRFQIVQCNFAAHEQGIRPGMGLGSASALCHSLQVHPYDEKVEQQTLLDIAQWLYMVTSDLVLFPPQGLLLKVTDMLSLYGGLDAYWRRVSQHLQQLNIQYQYATGFSPFSAILLAKSGSALISQDRSQLCEALKSYPISATELDSKQVEKLSRVGVLTLNDLLELPMQEVARRFDIDLVNYVGRLMGQFKHPVNFYHPPEHFQSYLELLFDIENTQWLEKPLLKLLEKLEGFLTLRNQVAYELELTLHQRDHAAGVIAFTSACGDYFAQRWAKLCQLTMESIKLDAPVQGLTLKVVRSGELESTSQDIFAGRKGQQTELELIATLQAKLGNHQVLKVAPTDDPRPEKSISLCAPELPIPTKVSLSGLRPSLMLPNPEPLTEKVNIMHGPERFVTGWWDGEEMTRDYFIARSDSGRWLWVFRNQEMQWFLHGLFS
ncbi:DNA polymerase Y family protein [Vibrio coralliilyticus]|uniref:Y-family DNA polymerase n=1 Tax=Vibrio TaxID=662 RepID=UPI0005020B59|nr:MULTISPECIES: DNA polymerase Y family protein [Vibrio]KFI10531.1 nucleotidyltransferase [Vibrio sp. B183]NOI18380.1 DNA polymerase Y family protein [Vibrio coralliilyticus]